MATRRGRKYRFDPCVDTVRRGDIAPFLSILVNNIQIYGSDTKLAPPTFIAKTLVEYGGIAFIRETGDWAAFKRSRRDRRTGMPRYVRLIGDAGYLSEELYVPEENDGPICIIPANAYFHPPEDIIRDKVKSLFMAETALAQNIDALKQCMLIKYTDKDLKASIDNAEMEREMGASAVCIPTTAFGDVEIANFSPEGKCYLTELLAYRSMAVEEIDASTGRVTIGEKTERRTDDEISVIENSACSTIDTIIDSFNRYAEWYGLDAHAVRGVELRRNAQEGETVGESDETQDDAQTPNDEAEEGNSDD